MVIVWPILTMPATSLAHGPEMWELLLHLSAVGCVEWIVVQRFRVSEFVGQGFVLGCLQCCLFGLTLLWAAKFKLFVLLDWIDPWPFECNRVRFEPLTWIDSQTLSFIGQDI